MYKLYLLFLIVFFTFSASLNAQNHSSSKKSLTALEDAVSLYKAGKKTQAETLLSSFLKKNTSSTNQSYIYQSYLTLIQMHSKRAAFNEQKKALNSLQLLLNQWGFQDTTEMVYIKRLIAQNQIQSGNDIEGIKSLSESLSLAKKVYPAASVELTKILIPLARAHINRLEVTKSESYLAQAEQIISGKKNTQKQIILGEILQLKGELLFRQGKTYQAEKIYRQALEIRKQTLGETSLAVGQTTIALAGALKGLHFFPQAEELYRQGFILYEKNLGPEHLFIATLLNNLGQLYYLQGRYIESENILKHAMKIKLKHYQNDHISVAETSNHLGYLYYLLERDDEAKKYFNKAIKIWSKQESNRPRYTASAQTWLAVILHRQGNSKGALKQLEQALNTLQKKYGADNILTSQVYHHLGRIHSSLKHFNKAEQYYLKGLKAAEQFGQNDRLEQLLINSELSAFYLNKNKKTKALKQSRKAINGLKQRVLKYSGLRAQSLTTELKSLKTVALTHIDIIYELTKIEQDSNSLINESFETAQLSRSTSTARALSNMAVRFSSGSNQLAEKIKEHQNYLQNWQEIDAILSASLAKSKEQRNYLEEERLRQHANEIKEKIDKTGTQINEEFPNYNNLTTITPISIHDIQSSLKPKEALITYLFGSIKSYLWVIKKNNASLYRLDINENELKESVQTLRNNLVPRFLEIDDTTLAPSFPVNKSHQLFKKTLMPAYDNLKDISHLIIIADGALQSLPISLLVVTPPLKITQPEDYKNIHWLIRDKSFSALPAVNSLDLLRKINTIQPKAKQSFIGFGDPSLIESVKKISQKQQKNKLKMRGVSSLQSIIGSSRSAVPIDILSEMAELPETAFELKRISSILNGNQDDIFLRYQATEQILNKQPLNHYRIIHFATHGLMAGDFEGLFEPAIVLTPSLFALDSKNNGLLTASEIAQLNLNAEMVVLSACNTAASNGKPGAEGLSGLGKAFFYAGSQRLLVTHWEVSTNATVKLVNDLFVYLKYKPDLSISEAHRLATLELMKQKYMHPMFWAPYMIVGAE